MQRIKRIHPVLGILAVFAIVMGIATASIRPALASDGTGDSACSRGDRAPVCLHLPAP